MQILGITGICAKRKDRYLDLLTAGKRHRFVGDPGNAARHRRLPAEQLLDCAGNDVGILDDLASVLGVLGQVGEETRQRIADGVQAGDDEQERDVDDVLVAELVAADLGGEELADDVVARFFLRVAIRSAK